MTLCKIFAKPEIELKLLNELEQKEQFSRFGIFVSDFLKHMIRLKKVSKQKHNLENLRLMIKILKHKDDGEALKNFMQRNF